MIICEYSDKFQTMFLKRNPSTLSKQKGCCIQFGKSREQDNLITEADRAKVWLASKSNRINYETSCKKSLKRSGNNSSFKKIPRDFQESVTVQPFMGVIESFTINDQSPNLTNNLNGYRSDRDLDPRKTPQMQPEMFRKLQAKGFVMVNFEKEKKVKKMANQLASSYGSQFSGQTDKINRSMIVRNQSESRFPVYPIRCSDKLTVSVREPSQTEGRYCIRVNEPQKNISSIPQFRGTVPELVQVSKSHIKFPVQQKEPQREIKQQLSFQTEAFNSNAVKRSDVNSTEVDMLNSRKHMENSILNEKRMTIVVTSTQHFSPAQEKKRTYLSARKNTIESINDGSSFRDSEESIIVSRGNLRATQFLEENGGFKKIPGLISNIFA